jgi:hypothetical protein
MSEYKQELPAWLQIELEKEEKQKIMRKFKALVNESGSTDFGMSGQTLQCLTLKKDKIYEECQYNRNYFIDDDGVSRGIDNMLKKGYIEEIK